VHNELKRLSEKAVTDGFTCNLDFDTKCLTANTEAEAGHVERVAKKYLPEPNVFTNGTLPFRASEDFGEYTKVKPGAFFFFCTK
jgi:metal-dependent amidase/aminoacylase/carboxypeptidase family protein